MEKRAKTKSMTTTIFMVAICTIIGLVSTFFAFRIVYPNKYGDFVKSNAQTRNIDANLIRAVIWVESKYDKEAKSSAGAVGLMQIMPSTAEWLKTKTNLVQYNLNDPSDNIAFGSFYIKYLIDKYHNTELALVAYNAGPTNLDRWLNDTKYSNDGRLIDIPYKETKNYVKKVLKTKTIYDKLFY